MKKTASVLSFVVLVLASFLMIGFSQASTTPTLTVDPATQQFPSAKIGDTIQVNITINDVQNLWLWDITDIKFNSAIINLTGVTEGPFLQKAGQQTIFVTAAFTGKTDPNYWPRQGHINDTTAAILSSTGVNGSGVIETLTFKVLSLGTSQIGFGQINLEQPNIDPNELLLIPSNAVNATVTLGGSTPSNSPLPTPTASPTGSQSPMGSPSSTPIPTAPEFPLPIIIIGLLIAVSLFTIIVKKRYENQSSSFLCN